jgi:hypothetical protein
MKGKFELRFNAPNVARVRSRLINVPADFTSVLRVLLNEAAAEVVEENAVAMKSKVVAKLNAHYPELAFTSKAHADAVCNPLNDFFTVFTAPTKEAFNARFGVDARAQAEIPTDGPETEEAGSNASKKVDVKKASKELDLLDSFED